MTSSPEAVTAELKFLADRSAPLVYVPSRGGGDQTEHVGNYRSTSVTIRDARREFEATDIDHEGFALVPHTSAVGDFYDDAKINGTYHDELATLITNLTGARQVIVFDDTRRSSSLAKQAELGIREPANIVHNDYTAASGPRRVDDYFADDPETAAQLKTRRYAIINVWRSIAGPVLDQPLVMGDASHLDAADLVSVERRAEERIGELQVVLHNPTQRWYYYPAMTRDEALVFKTFDSSEDGRARFTPHSAFVNPNSGPDTPPRESIESRCLVFF